MDESEENNGHFYQLSRMIFLGGKLVLLIESFYQIFSSKYGTYFPLNLKTFSYVSGSWSFIVFSNNRFAILWTL
ncbi:hypothetical protein HA466_0020940 [Hirschfeldia incana]|nr:hypothetical protein HA466_0020940 [Hirschfeldia incana]